MILEVFNGVPREFFWPWAFILGLLVGSFLNVVIYRLPLGRSVVSPPSACTSCNTPLQWYLNIPLLSYFVLGGRCRYCGTKFSVRYAALEFVSGCFFLASAVKFGFLSPVFVKATALFCLSLAVFFIDYDHWIIPDSINFGGAVLGIVFSFFVPLSTPSLIEDVLGVEAPSWSLSLSGAAFGWLFFWCIQAVGLALAKQEAMGGGDVKYAVLIGAFLGPSAALWAFLGSFFLGAFFALPLLLIRGGGGKDPLPFGTFMAISAVLVQFFGVDALLSPLGSWFFPL